MVFRNGSSDLKMLLIFKSWVERFFFTDTLKWGGCVLVHRQEIADESTTYWSKHLGVKPEKLSKPVVVVSRASKRKRNTLPYGTMQLKLQGTGCWVVAAKIKKAIEELPHTGQ